MLTEMAKTPPAAVAPVGAPVVMPVGDVVGAADVVAAGVGAVTAAADGPAGLTPPTLMLVIRTPAAAAWAEASRVKPGRPLVGGSASSARASAAVYLCTFLLFARRPPTLMPSSEFCCWVVVVWLRRALVDDSSGPMNSRYPTARMSTALSTPPSSQMRRSWSLSIICLRWGRT